MAPAIAATLLTFGLGLAAGLVAFGVFSAWPSVNLRTLLPRDLAHESFYRMRLSEFQQLRGQSYDITMAGDSLTELGPWSELFPGVKIANRGISGDLAELIAKRLDTVQSTRARKTFLMFGVNNLRLGTDVAGTFRSYQRVIDALAPRSCVVVQSTIPTSNALANARIGQLNARLRSYCVTTGRCQYLDIDKTIAPTGKLTPAESPDGMHLYGVAYVRWRDAIAPALHAARCG